MAPWFRTEFQKDGKLRILKSKLDEYGEVYDRGLPLYRTIYRTEVRIEDSEFLDAKFLYKELLNTDEDYKIRVEKWHSFNIYSNNLDFLNHLAANMKQSAVELWKPKQTNIDSLLENKNIIIVDKEPDLAFKVTLKTKRIDPSFANWLKANTDKSRVGKGTLENIERGWGSGTYFFVRDEKVLSMVELIISDSIQRIERLVYKANIDK